MDAHVNEPAGPDGRPVDASAASADGGANQPSQPADGNPNAAAEPADAQPGEPAERTGSHSDGRMDEPVSGHADEPQDATARPPGSGPASGPPASGPAPRQPMSGRRRAVAAALGLIAVLFFVLSPWPFDRKLRLVGFACCTQAPSRTISIAGQLMPVDARDAGIYLAVLLGIVMAVAVGRGRCGRWPPPSVAGLLGGLFMAMVIDGINSTLQVRGLHTLYHTTNTLRVITGAGAGLALAILGLPLVNRVLWRAPEDDAIASDYGELAGFVVATAILVALLLAPPARLYYPLAILSVLGVLVGWGLVNGVIVAVATRQENRATTVADAGLFLLAGIVLSLCEIWLVGAIRGRP